MYTTLLLIDAETTLYKSCDGAPIYHVSGRADGQLEVNIVGSYWRGPTTGAMESLRRMMST